MMSTSGCAGGRAGPSDPVAPEGVLAPCPASPNCVSSDAGDEAHRVDAISISGDVAAAWAAAREVVAALPRTTIVVSDDAYLHAECRSRLFRFVDDLELALRSERGEIAVRSASRIGHSDLGVNRARVEEIRSVLRTRGASR